MATELTIHLPDIDRHPKQKAFIRSKAKRKVIRAGRRGGKTVGVSVLAVEQFLKGRRVLYATPTADQIQRFWFEVANALAEPILAKVFEKNESNHSIERTGTTQRIRAKTAWNADTLRGDFADVLILDEFQLMAEDTWEIVGAPMLLDNNGDAAFVYTPPSIRTAGTSKARDKRHAAKLFKRAEADTSGRWQAFHFSSHDNPFISKDALQEITKDMSHIAYEQEIMAQDVEDAPGALWTRAAIESKRVLKAPDDLDLVIVGVDPSATSTGDEAGIVTNGRKGSELYTLADDSLQGSPKEWASAAVSAYYLHKANKIVAESNNGGEMVAAVISQVDPHVPVKLIYASRGKQTRAEPIAAIYEQGRGHHVGEFGLLEDELCQWTPGDASPNRLDAHVWSATELMLVVREAQTMPNLFSL